MKNEIIISQQQIENRIFTIRDKQVMIDRDLAEMYQVETKVLNQAVKRNIERFPDRFMFRLTKLEKNELVTHCDRLKNLKHSTTTPYVFTEQGAVMLSSILKSDMAVHVSIQIMDAFVQIRQLIGRETIQHIRLSNVENKLIQHDQKIHQLFHALEKNELPQKGIFINGQVFDAFRFVADIIRKADKSLILIDNYIDDTVLTLLDKRKEGVKCRCYTKQISKSLKLDLQKHNEQYEKIEIYEFKVSHDRFMVIDEEEIYHLGASLKDLGKRWFAFSKMEWDSMEKLMSELRVSQFKDIE